MAGPHRWKRRQVVWAKMGGALWWPAVVRPSIHLLFHPSSYTHHPCSHPPHTRYYTHSNKLTQVTTRGTRRGKAGETATPCYIIQFFSPPSDPKNPNFIGHRRKRVICSDKCLRDFSMPREFLLALEGRPELNTYTHTHTHAHHIIIIASYASSSSSSCLCSLADTNRLVEACAVDFEHALREAQDYRRDMDIKSN